MAHVSRRPFRSQVGIQDMKIRLWGSHVCMRMCVYGNISERLCPELLQWQCVVLPCPCSVCLISKGKHDNAEGVRKLIWGIASYLARCPDELRIAILFGSFLGTAAKTASQSYVPFCLSHVPAWWGRVKSLRSHGGKGQVFPFYIWRMTSSDGYN